MESIAAVTPLRMSLINVSSLEELEAQFNPAELNEKIGAEFAKIKIQGLSHERMQFAGTTNNAFSFTLFFASMNGGPERQAYNMRARRFLKSACYPRGGLSGLVSSGGAPRIIFAWPGIATITTFITSVEFSYQRFNFTGEPVYFSAKVSLERVLDGLLTSEDVFAGKD